MGENVKKNKNIVGIVVFGVVVFALIGVIYFTSNSKSAKTKYETKQLELFTSAVEKGINDIDTTGKSYEEVQVAYSDVIRESQKKFGGSSATGVDAYAINLLNTVNGSKNGTTSDLMSKLTGLLDGLDIAGFIGSLLGGSNESNATTSTLTLASTTACKSVADSKYCLDGKSKKLSANVYVVDKESSKWVVLVHPFMTSGSLIYNSLGYMYESQGYNVLAPDLRGFGKSDGSVAMGYLESLDIYDWIKDLNSNYSSRYGVNIAPDTIIVHGISLGGATTLQLATNPDMAAAKGEPYTKTLTQLNVKGFVDDCGYTSMSGIITGMLSMGDTSSLTSLLGNLGLDEVDFMSELQKLLGKFNVKGFEGFDVNSFSGIEGLTGQFSELYEAITKASNNSNVSSSVSSVLGDYLGNADLGSIIGEYGKYFGSTSSNWPSNGGSASSNGSASNNGSSNWPSNGSSSNKWWENYNEGSASKWGNSDWNKYFGGLKGTSSTSNSKVTLVNKSTNNSGNFLDGIVGTVLMNLVGVGLTEDNYDYYSDVFASGRSFPTNSKVLIIHGTSDTTVPHSNAKTVASNAGNRLFYQWNASGKPHAFVVIGTDTDRYANLVSEFTDCIDGESCSVTPLD